MKVKMKWTDSNFEEMGWHDSRLYSIAFPRENLVLSLNIDYIFKWVEREDEAYNFWVAPCLLKFHNVLNLKIDIDFSNSVGIDIQLMKRIDKGVLSNGKMRIWEYFIDTDKGNISFLSTGFVQDVLDDPILSESQYILYANRFC